MVLSDNERSDFYQLLLDKLGEINIYFQPPPSVKLVYPCLICELDRITSRYADDTPYTQMSGYTLTLITRKLGGNGIVEKLLELKHCSFDRFFTSDNLNHYVFTIYI